MSNHNVDEVLENLPEKWFSEDELKIFINKAFVDHIRVIAKDFDIEVQKEADIARLYELLSEEAGSTIDEIEQNMYQAAHFVARLAIFTQKFPHIVSEFPIHEASGQSIFPTKVLARILNIDEQEAAIIAHHYWNVGNNPESTPDVH